VEQVVHRIYHGMCSISAEGGALDLWSGWCIRLVQQVVD